MDSVLIPYVVEDVAWLFGAKSLGLKVKLSNFINELLENTHLDVYKIGDDAYYEVLRFKNNNKIAYLKNKTIWKVLMKAIVNDVENYKLYNKNGFIDWMRNTIQKEDAGGDLNLWI